MPEAGFFAQKRNSPTSLGLVILLHAAVITAVVLIKSPTFIHALNGPIVITTIPDEPVPPPDQPPPRPHEQPQPQPESIDRPPPLIPTPPIGPTVDTRPTPLHLADNTVGSGVIPQLPPPPPLPIPIRRAAQIDSASRLQPPYPAAEIRAGRDGRVQVRVTIGADGRVSGITLISATSDAFWQATQQQALRFWRFHPATVDGRPVEETRVMSVVFRLEDQA